ncbi:MAG TPA: pyridoxamine 5'-phosphate oxidase family protein [Rhizobiales bacterium]|nr:pyridoxamine 5'-phosphate oxidase family protein [Hyphomicrobiales bacterium]
MIETVEELEAIYGQPGKASMAKETDVIIPQYRALIEASPFVALASVGPEGLDCTPRGDRPGFVRVDDEKTLMMPDRRGNNRIDTLKNIIRDPRVALLFVIPGSLTTFRVNGSACVSVDEDLLKSFAEGGKAPRSVIVIKVEAAYFQCGRAIIRSQMWDATSHVDPDSLPSAGEMIAATTGGEAGGEDYDVTWNARAEKTLW